MSLGLKISVINNNYFVANNATLEKVSLCPYTIGKETLPVKSFELQ
ncbi:hypothetical protein HMPREF1557_00905 [Streptococcus sobrinus W1703]|uniref:Uncharacterized protein n=1 Tax=Streptococcus sobrinus W1703 TaxID=1227275 RepID=U2KH77_9STRE|nr:hypothetical protein HMPREF1557_00905 [Streptococcus sobrinus W1703]